VLATRPRAVAAASKAAVIADLAADPGARPPYSELAFRLALEWRQYQSKTGSMPWRIWQGASPSIGALIGGTLAVIVIAAGASWPSEPLDCASFLSVALASAIGRWGNFFIRGLFGPCPPIALETLDFRPSIWPAPFIDEAFFPPHLLYESFWKTWVFWPVADFFFPTGERGKISLPNWCPQLHLSDRLQLGRYLDRGLRLDPLCLFSIPPLL